MEPYSDLDTSSESDYESGQESSPGSDCDEIEPSQNLEPEPSALDNNDEFDLLWNPQV